MTYKEAWEQAKKIHNGDTCYGADWIDIVYELMEEAEKQDPELVQEQANDTTHLQ